ncbi:hypothetical protein [Hafnia phage yong2]|nr:hypothetical protein [Hafnia phage yong2]
MVCTGYLLWPSAIQNYEAFKVSHTAAPLKSLTGTDLALESLLQALSHFNTASDGMGSQYALRLAGTQQSR